MKIKNPGNPALLRATVLSVTSLLLLTSCSSAKLVQTPDGRIEIRFDFGKPDLFAWRDGNDAWQFINNPSDLITLDIQNQGGNFDLVSYGLDRGAYIGYHFQGTYKEFPNINLRFDPTVARTNYTVEGSIDNTSNKGASVYLGYDFKTNKLDIPGGGLYNYQLDLDSDESSIADLLTVGQNFSLKHYFAYRGLDLSTNPVGISNTLQPDQVGRTYDNDVSGVFGGTGYAGFRSKLFLQNTKALLVQNTTDMNITAEKLPANQVEADDLYHNSVTFKRNLGMNISHSTVFAKVRHEPGHQVFDQQPNWLPGISFTSDADNSYIAQFDQSYDQGVSGLNKQFYKVEATFPTIKWVIGASYDRLAGNAVEQLKFPTEITNLQGFDPQYIPDPATQTNSRVSVYGSNKMTADFADYIQSGQTGDRDDDNMDFFRATVRYTF